MTMAWKLAPGLIWHPPAPPLPLAEVRAQVEAHNAAGTWPPLTFTDHGGGGWSIVPDRTAPRLRTAISDKLRRREQT